MKCLVTGATGFLGGHLVRGFCARGHEVRAFVRDPIKVQELARSKIEVRVGDIRDREAVSQAMRDIDVVLHCAAASEQGLSKKALRETNLDGARNLLEEMRAAKNTRLVHVSGLSALGIRDLHPASEELPRRRSGDPEADIKVEIEEMIDAYGRDHDIDAVILRPSIVYGDGDANLSQVLDAIRAGKFAYIGSRSNIVPLVHISDFIQMAHLAAARLEARGRTYHVADGTETSIGDIVDCLGEISGSPKPSLVLPYFIPYGGGLLFEMLQWLRLRSKPGPIDRAALRFLGTSRSVPIGRAQEELGYEPQTLFRDGISATYRQSEVGTDESRHHVAGA
jgi:nucleoside-diphosphate-sugar epimerase